MSRFWDKVEKTDGCWLWTAGRYSTGYGQFWFMGKGRLAHRFAYEDQVGPIPDGMTLDHLCKMRHCVNPAHLEPVTRTENTMRGDSPHAENARKTHCEQGHEFDGINNRGNRICRECGRVAWRRWKAKQNA